MEKRNQPIGVFDSGVGGISVLRELVRLMPGENFLYFGDSANAPYGTRTAQEVIDFTIKHTEFLFSQGAKAIVIACNTATSVAIQTLRDTYPDRPVIGIEPALKPAVLAREHSHVLVMATPMTLEQEKFNALLHVYEKEASITKVPCPGLVELIESGKLEGTELFSYLEKRFASFDKATVDAVVLGCTHYPLIKPAIQSIFPASVIYDGGYGTAKQTRKRLLECHLLSEQTSGGTVHFFNSRNTEAMLALSERLLALP